MMFINDDHAEVYRVDAERLRGGMQHRDDHQQDGRALEEAAEDEQQDVRREQEDQRRELVRLQRRAEGPSGCSRP
jgi:hypothetical protein